MKKALFLLLVLLSIWLFIRFVIGGNEDSWICVDNQWVKDGNPSSPMPEEGCGQEKSEKLIGGDKDEHGCLLMAGYTWCEPKQKCLREWEENCDGIRD